jgi:glycosyltransferase involved in cell wall biosynthesis
VLTHSEFSRQRILALCQVAEERVITIPCGVDSEYFHVQPTQEINKVLEKYSIAEDYIFMVGSIEPRKNLPALFKAWDIFRQEHDSFQLVIAGGRGRGFREVGMNDHPKGINILGYVDENDLPPLYSGAVICINPSLYEGFGLPVLEAMASGTAVIASNITALPEAVGDAGLLIDPFDIDEMAAALESLVSDPNSRDTLIEKGLVRAKSYSWDETANQVWEAIQRVRDRN